MVPASIIREAWNVGECDPLFSRALAPPFDHLLPPLGEVSSWKWQSRLGGIKDVRISGHVFTDGSGFHPRDPLLRRAGWGALQIDQDGDILWEMWGPLPMLPQTVPAAELFAVLAVVAKATPPLHIYTDCEVVVKGWKNGAEWCVQHERALADVWSDIWTLVAKWPPQSFFVHKTKAHASEGDVMAGITTHWERRGNDAVDAVAKRGALIHAVPDEVVKLYRLQAWKQRIVGKWLGIVTVEAAVAQPVRPHPLNTRVWRGGGRRADKDDKRNRHDLERESGNTWRCGRCNARASTLSSLRRLRSSTCPGPVDVRSMQAVDKERGLPPPS